MHAAISYYFTQNYSWYEWVETCMHNKCLDLYGNLTPLFTMLAKQNERKRHLKSACGLIEGKFVNTRELLSLFMRNRQRGCLRLPVYLSGTCRRNVSAPFKVCVVRVYYLGSFSHFHSSRIEESSPVRARLKHGRQFFTGVEGTV